MNLKEQRYICVLAQCGNISRAAEKLFISQPALSIYVNNLEKAMGVKLFDRSGKKFVLTAAGEIYVSKAEKMLELESQFNQELNDLRNHVGGTIVCGVQLRRAPQLLPPVMAKFREEYPRIKVILKEGVRKELEYFLNENQVHILIDNLEELRDDLVAYPLYTDLPLLALPADHPLNEKAVWQPGESYPFLDISLCKDCFFILPTQRQSLRSHVDKVFADYHMNSVNYMEVSNFETAMQLVAEGYGIGFNRQQYTKTMYYKKEVRYYRFGKDKSGDTKVYAIYQNGRTLPAYTQRFLELLIQHGSHINDEAL